MLGCLFSGVFVWVLFFWLVSWLVGFQFVGVLVSGGFFMSFFFVGRSGIYLYS